MKLHLTISFHGMYLWKESHAYDKGKALVVSKVPLPMYRADLDERHGSTQKEVQYIQTTYCICIMLSVKAEYIHRHFSIF